MLKLIGWTEGHFHFQAGWKSNRKTISIPLSAIILQGMHLLDSTEYLLSIGVRNESILLRTDFDRTEADFERQLADVEILDMAACKAFYLAINDRRSSWRYCQRPESAPQQMGADGNQPYSQRYSLRFFCTSC